MHLLLFKGLRARHYWGIGKFRRGEGDHLHMDILQHTSGFCHAYVPVTHNQNYDIPAWVSI